MQETMVAVFSETSEMAAKARAANVNHSAAVLGRKLLKRVRAKVRTIYSHDFEW